MSLLPISERDKLFFTKHLAVLIASGVPISESLTLLTEENKNLSLESIVRSLDKDIANGNTLSQGLNKYPNVFNSFYRNIISIGEETGTLDKNLSYLANVLEKNMEFKRKVQGVLLYPAIVLTLAAVVAGGISIFVLPQLSDLFSSLTIPLPLTTRILIAVSIFMKQNGIVVIGLFFLLIAALFFGVTNKVTRKFFDPITIRLPIVGNIIRQIEVANLCRNLGIMLKSGLPITRSFEIARDTTENSIFKQYVNTMYKAISAGQTLESELTSNRYPFIPTTLPRMLGVGEHSGTLDESLLYMADYYAEEVNDTTKRLPEILEPALLIFIAGVVLFVALAIITPIYQFTGSIHP